MANVDFVVFVAVLDVVLISAIALCEYHGSMFRYRRQARKREQAFSKRIQPAR